MRTIMSTMAPYGTSKYLVDITQSALSKNKHCVTNSSSFVNEAETWETTQEKIQVSYYMISLYPFIPIEKTITILIDTFNNDLDDLNTRTKLTLKNRHQLTDLCLSNHIFSMKTKLDY